MTIERVRFIARKLTRTRLHFQKAMEEAIEISGMALIFTAFATHLAALVRDVRLRFV